MSAIKKELNTAQWDAVSYCEGPSLIIAGAGSGKTRVLTYKIAYLIEQGMEPWRILALTFTNKAAREMRDRIANVVGFESAQNIWNGTFHSIFARILRLESDVIGYPHDFTIYDQTDSRSLIKNIVKEMGLDDKTYKPNIVSGRISEAKNALVLPGAYLNDRNVRERDQRDGIGKTGEIYRTYMQRCFAAGAMDFDDLLLNTFLLFQEHPEVRGKYSERFSYILVDEYQDTNVAQHRIITQLTSPTSKICVVGDDAQSIYSFRGARIDNILGFQEQYPTAKLFKLERNYRSTQNIVNAADSLIKHNAVQIPKKVYSEAEVGEPLKIIEAYSDKEESIKVAGVIRNLHNVHDVPYNEIAILYRTNAQSRSFEETFRSAGMPYRIYGGLSFYQRKEVKDLLAYFRLICNPSDEEAFKRIVNYPARGIGATTMSKIQMAAVENGETLWNVAANPQKFQVSLSKSTQGKLLAFLALIEKFRNDLHRKNGSSLATDILYSAGINADLLADTSAEGISKKENIEELLGAIKANEDEARGSNAAIVPLTDYISKVSLLTDADQKDDGSPRITLMTVHAAKGLEFDAVFVTGLENDLFPNSNARFYPKEMEEERRLFYVAITRAKSRCYLTYAKSRFRFGNMEFGEPSIFLREINQKYLDKSPFAASVSTTPGRIPNKNAFSKSTSSLWDNPPSGTTCQEERHQSKPRASSRETADDKRFKKRIYNNGRILQQIGSSSKANDSATPPEMLSSAVEYGSTTLKAGDKVAHERFGMGTVISVEGSGNGAKAQIDFEKGVGIKKLLLKFAKLRKIE